MATTNWKLKEKIAEKSRTQADFGFSVGVAESIVSKVVRGRRTLAIEERQKWADALGAQIDEIFEKEDDNGRE